MQTTLDVVPGLPIDETGIAIGGADGAFDFQASAGPPSESEKKVAEWKPSCGMYFFTVVSSQPGRLRTVIGGPKIHDPNVLVVAPVNVMLHDVLSDQAWVALERLGGEGEDCLYVLSMHDLCLDDFNTLRQWKVGKCMQYVFDHTRLSSRDFCPETQGLIRGMLKARRKADDNPFTIKAATDIKMHSAVEYLADQDVVTYERAGGDVHCKLSKLGERSLQPSMALSEPSTVLEVRKVDHVDMTIFELLRVLQFDGWVLMTKVPKRMKDATGVPFSQPVDYDPRSKGVAATKYMWTRKSGDPVGRFYLLALLAAPRLDMPIAHLKPEAYYKCLLEGRPYIKKRKHD